MRTLFFTVAITALTCGAAIADCQSEIEKTIDDWRALKLVPSKPGAPSKGIRGHEHITAVVSSMQFHLAEAKELCDAGNSHEALLHLNIIRAFLDLPEFQHPRSHLYLYNGGRRQP